MAAGRVRTKNLRWWVSAAGLAALLALAIRQGGFPVGAAEADPQPAPATTATTLASPPGHGTEEGESAQEQTVTSDDSNPTPQRASVAPQPALPVQRNQVVLLGTTIADDGSFAFVRDIAGAPSRVLRKGDRINGLSVTEIRPDRLRLTDGATGREVILEVGDEARPGADSTTTQAFAPVPLAASQSNVTSAAPRADGPGIRGAVTLRRRSAGQFGPLNNGASSVRHPSLRRIGL